MDGPIILPDFSDLHILVVGDVMIDRYISGKVSRISPEAPVPVVEYQSTDNRAGGAANVALNLKALEARVSLLSISGNDENHTILSSILERNYQLNTHLIQLQDRKTTIKTRIMAGNQHLLRIDSEDTHDITEDEECRVFDKFKKIIASEKVDGVILQDYNKGLLTESLIKNIIQTCNHQSIPTYVDPKKKNFFAYQNCTLFKPNKKEVIEATGEQDLNTIDAIIRNRLHHQISMITLGSHGIYFHDGHTGQVFPTTPRVISDVCGAGDSVISIACLCHLKDIDLNLIAVISNIAGGQVCEYPGVVPIQLSNLRDELNNQVV